MSFDAKKHMIKTRGGKEYLPVAARIVWFRMEHPDWGIVTEPHTIDMEQRYSIYRATIMDEGGKIIATATKQECFKDFPDFLEKSETGAVGRALAMCGYGTQNAPEFAEVDSYGEGRVVDTPQASPRSYQSPKTDEAGESGESGETVIAPSPSAARRLGNTTIPLGRRPAAA